MRNKIGILLVNLGTPDAPTPAAVRRYLREFLSDRRVVELPRFLWLPILYGPILALRPRKSAYAYAKIWDQETDSSPLRRITIEQAQGLAAAFADRPDVVVGWAMRYGAPAIGDEITKLQDQGCARILLFPLYPQYSAATTASVQDKAFAALADMRAQPAIRTVPAYYDEPEYIAAVAASVVEARAGLGWQPQVYVASFHGMPRRTHELGDPYYRQCLETGRALGSLLGLDDQGLRVCFQSRFGPAAWLQPYCADTVVDLARRGVKRVMLLTPGFAADCLETLEELDIGLRAAFLRAGGSHFHRVSCLNATPRSIALLEQICRREISGW